MYLFFIAIIGGMGLVLEKTNYFRSFMFLRLFDLANNYCLLLQSSHRQWFDNNTRKLYYLVFYLQQVFKPKAKSSYRMLRFYASLLHLILSFFLFNLKHKPLQDMK